MLAERKKNEKWNEEKEKTKKKKKTTLLVCGTHFLKSLFIVGCLFSTLHPFAWGRGRREWRKETLYVGTSSSRDDMRCSCYLASCSHFLFNQKGKRAYGIYKAYMVAIIGILSTYTRSRSVSYTHLTLPTILRV